jgi:hypothetical protein
LHFAIAIAVAAAAQGGLNRIIKLIMASFDVMGPLIARRL